MPDNKLTDAMHQDACKVVWLYVRLGIETQSKAHWKRAEEWAQIADSLQP